MYFWGLNSINILQVIEIFQLKISEDQLMSRCTKCNGRFIQKPLTTEEAIEAAKGFQRIPNCLFDKNLEFWQCMDCNQLYWEVVYCFFSLFFKRNFFSNTEQHIIRLESWISIYTHAHCQSLQPHQMALFLRWLNNLTMSFSEYPTLRPYTLGSGYLNFELSMD